MDHRKSFIRNLDAFTTANIACVIVRYKPNKSRSYYWLSRDPNITWEIVKANPDRDWCYTELTENPDKDWD